MTPKPNDHQHANGNGFNLSGMPIWMRFAAIVGVPSIIALYLVQFTTTRATAQFDRIEARIETNSLIADEQANSLATLVKAADGDRAQMRTLIALQRQVCVNTSKNDAQRDQCLK